MKLGDLDIFVVSDGLFRLDGGAMFGVVPRVLWERTDPPDEKNRILMGLNCLLVIRGNEKILIDTGVGDKFDEKFANMFGIHREKTLLDQLADLRLQPEDITHVIMSHLHFDHIGWNTRRNAAGEIVPTFPNAVYFAQRGEYEAAQNPDERSRASYLKWNWEALEKSGQLQLLDGTTEVLPGIESFLAPGHTLYHTIIKIKSAGKTAAFLADLVPTTSHLKTPYVMGYDLYPKLTMETKPRILQQAFEEQWLLVFEHAPRIKAGYLQKVEGNWKVGPVGPEA
ncbi:MAG: MBL fold metallo-hydrolase [candidate division KSB1 bacterium]|nr:MBL fold metallo-hydrolase [candidate division KSB1 bacterium]MDZ7368011.1 MBL fold metallo-hydrolase [candidate division KSB1 bacterium]MDZ7405634.1 MBL fold metallo-hydrolase [candidate division KSB1 bacterium]